MTRRALATFTLLVALIAAAIAGYTPNLGVRSDSDGTDTLSCSDNVVFYGASTTINLPDADTLPCVKGRVVRVCATGVYTLTVNRAGSDTLDNGATSVTLTASSSTTGQCWTLTPDTTTNWRSLRSGSAWTLIYDQSLASVDVVSATFDLGGKTWTKQNSAAGGTPTSDASGLTLTPAASTTSTTGIAYTSPLSGFDAAYDQHTLLICGKRQNVETTCSTPTTGYMTQTVGVADEDGNPGGYAESACNSTTPSGWSDQASKVGGSPFKLNPAVVQTGVHWLCVKLADALTTSMYYGTSATLDPNVLVEIAGPHNLEAVAPGGVWLAEAVRIYASRGDASSAAFAPRWERITIYRATY